MADIPRQALCDVIRREGDALVDNPQRCETLLMQECPRFRSQVQILVHVMKSDVIEDVLRLPEDADWAEASDPLLDRLINDRGMEEAQARWALDSWGEALGKMSKRSFSLENYLTTQQKREKEQAPQLTALEQERALKDFEEQLAAEKMQSLGIGTRHLLYTVVASVIGGAVGGVLIGLILGTYIGAAVEEETKGAAGGGVMLGGMLGAVFGAVLPAIGAAFGSAIAFVVGGHLKIECEANQAHVKGMTTALCALVGSGAGAMLGGILCGIFGLPFGGFIGAALAVYGIASLVNKLWD